MMIVIKKRYGSFSRVTVSTPSLGAEGDMTDRSFAGDCDVDAILRKYGTVNYNRFTSVDCADVSDLPRDRLEMEIMMENVRAAHKEYGGDLDLNTWLASLFKGKDDKPVEDKPVEDKPVENNEDNKKEG